MLDTRFLSLLPFVLACFLAAAIGGWATSTTVDTWYVGLNKPPFTPPDWIFPPVWTALYAMMAFSGWRARERSTGAKRRLVTLLFGTQLAANLAWPVVFFGFAAIGTALAAVVVLWILVLIVCVSFWRVDTLAGALFVPYFAWVSYAAVLNGAIWQSN